LSLKHFGFLKERLVFLLRLPWKDGQTPILQLAFEKKCSEDFCLMHIVEVYAVAFDKFRFFINQDFVFICFLGTLRSIQAGTGGILTRSWELQVGTRPSHWSSELRSTLACTLLACELCWARSLLQILRILIAKNFQWPYSMLFIFYYYWKLLLSGIGSSGHPCPATEEVSSNPYKSSSFHGGLWGVIFRW